MTAGQPNVTYRVIAGQAVIAELLKAGQKKIMIHGQVVET